MKRHLAVIPSPSSGYVELAASASGTLFRKQILPMNREFSDPRNPKRKIRIDKSFAQKLVENFERGVCDTVQFPMVNEKNQHVENPEVNYGQVVDLSYDDSGVYATIDVRKNPEAVGTTLLGASAMFSTDYVDRWTGENVGPTLLHVAGTNRPYLTKLDPYERVVGLSESADTESEGELLMLSESQDKEEPGMDLDEMLEVLKNEHGVDVLALQERAKKADASELVASLSAVLRETDESVVALSASDENVTVADIAAGVIALSEAYTVTKSAYDELRTQAIEAEVDALVSAGRILPKQRDVMVRLAAEDREAFDALLPENAIVSLSESGVVIHDATPSEGRDRLIAEAERYAGLVTDK